MSDLVGVRVWPAEGGQYDIAVYDSGSMWGEVVENMLEVAKAQGTDTDAILEDLKMYFSDAEIVPQGEQIDISFLLRRLPEGWELEGLMDVPNQAELRWEERITAAKFAALYS